MLLLLLAGPAYALSRLASWIDWRLLAGVPLAVSLFTYFAYRGIAGWGHVAKRERRGKAEVAIPYFGWFRSFKVRPGKRKFTRFSLPPSRWIEAPEFRAVLSRFAT